MISIWNINITTIWNGEKLLKQIFIVTKIITTVNFLMENAAENNGFIPTLSQEAILN
jgi:hypothetical protein